MLETKETTIGGVRYKVTQLEGSQGIPLMVRLFKLIGPALGAALRAAGDAKDVKSILDMPLSLFGDGITELAERMTEAEFTTLVQLMTEKTQVHKGGDKWIPLTQDAEFHWAGRYLSLLRWVGYCLEVNYADFSAGLRGLAGTLAAQVPAPASPSPKGSTGPSGESSALSDSASA